MNVDERLSLAFQEEPKLLMLSWIHSIVEKSYPYYLDLIHNKLYGSPALLELYGLPASTVALDYEDWLKTHTMITDQTFVEKQKMRLIKDKRPIEMQIHVINQSTGATMRLYVKAVPHLNKKREVIGIYGVDKLMAIGNDI